ncbi:MAG: 50S ribosomal protein L18a [Thermoplasmata archaeon]|mgnify:CR=1 FL=1|nr:50S ribosomal protein L18a [Thermoplasmata archaeon]OYT50359.1 MAG: 50S ribosomal protein L18a [Thermoplasmatales archaeon ex4484_36]HDD59775.1 50S ribosomal protein L18a [Euryarchaeota archaeon]RLF55474.1 MAG: 50S ribosomal protein L18a [Thermoplasmata archaeon]RLF71754.1 MAG: 50S ribosomal protein L18a [Thermoplasmata archaeon]
MKPYIVEGYYPLPGGRQNFRKEVAAENEDEALEKVYSLIGSNHKVKRRFIRILSVREITPDEVRNPLVRFLVGDKKS